MATVPPTAVSVQRLAEQLHQLSEVTESLTYRLLELEERLEAQVIQLQSIAAGNPGLEEGSAAELEGRMGDTEERLSRIEAMLKGLDRPGPGALRHLHTLHPPAMQQEPLPEHSSPAVLSRTRLVLQEAPSEGTGEDSPFLEEGEQTFMDELTA